MNTGWGKIRNERQIDAKLIKLTAKRVVYTAAGAGTAVLLMAAKGPKRW